MRVAFLVVSAVAVGVSLGVCCAAHAETAKALDRREVEAEVVGDICSDGGQWLECYGQQPSACTVLASELVSRCFDRVFGMGPLALAPDAVDGAVEKLSDCFRSDFNSRYESFHKPSPECAVPPAHLQ
jgi:hypothetical protein